MANKRSHFVSIKSFSYTESLNFFRNGSTDSLHPNYQNRTFKYSFRLDKLIEYSLLERIPIIVAVNAGIKYAL